MLRSIYSILLFNQAVRHKQYSYNVNKKTATKQVKNNL
jgi:hypothetical protein